jgi:hypothetical protein
MGNKVPALCIQQCTQPYHKNMWLSIYPNRQAIPIMYHLCQIIMQERKRSGSVLFFQPILVLFTEITVAGTYVREEGNHIYFGAITISTRKPRIWEQIPTWELNRKWRRKALLIRCRHHQEITSEHQNYTTRYLSRHYCCLESQEYIYTHAETSVS